MTARNSRRASARRSRVARLALIAPLALASSALALTAAVVRPLAAQTPQTSTRAADVLKISLSPGRSFAVTLPAPAGKIAVTDPEIADAILISEREVVFNGKKPGETDILLWSGNARRHYRVSVSSAADRRQVVLSIKLAEVRREALASFGVSALGRSSRGPTRAGTGLFNTNNAIGDDGTITIPGEAGFLTVLSRLGTRDVLAFIEAEETRGNARTLAEPTLMAGNRDSASFLAGGEIPIPIAQPSANGQTFVTVVFREFGVRLFFQPEVLSDSLVKLKVRPEVSSLDYSNALLLSGFRVPALRTRRVESTVDVPVDRGLVISGLLNDERERVRIGVPLLSRLPLVGALFSSTRWQRNESELLVIVTPTIIDPERPRARDVVPLVQPDSLPAREALRPRLPQQLPSDGRSTRPPAR
ncbi:MAG: type II and III secretion system protein family protein [Gemmatirosa sp.]